MSCDKDMKRDVLLLAAGLLPAARAGEVQAHLAGCPACAALRQAVLEERAALKEAGAPLLAAGRNFAVVPEVQAAPARRFAFALAAAAACFAVFVLLRGEPRTVPGVPGGGMTPAPSGGFSVAEGSGPAPSDLLLKLSGRRAEPVYISGSRS